MQRLRNLNIKYKNIKWDPLVKEFIKKYVSFKVTFLDPLLHVTLCHFFYKLLHYVIDKLVMRYLFVY